MPARLSQRGPNRGSSRAETRSSPQLALESHHTPAQAVSNTYHLQLGLGRWGVQHRSVNRGKFFHSRVTNGNCLPADTFPPLPVWEVTAQFLPEEPPSATHLLLQELQLSHQIPAPGYRNPCPVLAHLWSKEES